MDRVGANFMSVVNQIRQKLGKNAVPLQLPIGAEDQFKGVIDLVQMKALMFHDEALGAKYDVDEIPAELRADAEHYREKMVESIAEQHDELLEKYLAGETLEISELKSALREATIAQKITPVLCGSAFKNKGVQPLLDAVVDYLPSPVDIEPKTKTDQEKMGVALAKLMQEDPTFKVHTDTETNQTIIRGMGELHLEIIVDRMMREFGVQANVGKPQVAYREAITRNSQAEGRFVRQSGGKGQYGHVKMRFEPLEGGGFEFVNEITGGSVPREFIKPTEQGIKEAMERGIIAGYPMTGIRAILYDGSYHDVDSSEMAFKIAGSMAYQEGAKKAGPILLEPIMDVEVVTPEDYAGDVMGDLSRRRGKIQQMDERGGAKVIRAHVPLSEMFGYATQVRSMSQGRASYTMQFFAYEPAPKSVADEVIAKVAG